MMMRIVVLPVFVLFDASFQSDINVLHIVFSSNISHPFFRTRFTNIRNPLWIWWQHVDNLKCHGVIEHNFNNVTDLKPALVFSASRIQFIWFMGLRVFEFRADCL